MPLWTSHTNNQDCRLSFREICSCVLVDFEFQFNFVYFARHNETFEFADAKDNRLVINFRTLLYENVLTAQLVSLLCLIFLICCFHRFRAHTLTCYKAFFLLSLKRNCYNAGVLWKQRKRCLKRAKYVFCWLWTNCVKTIGKESNLVETFGVYSLWHKVIRFFYIQKHSIRCEKRFFA